MKHEEFECDSCGKKREIGPGIVGWVDVAEVVLSTERDQRRWQLCSGTCMAVFAGTFKPGKTETSFNPETRLNLSPPEPQSGSTSRVDNRV